MLFCNIIPEHIDAFVPYFFRSFVALEVEMFNSRTVLCGVRKENSSAANTSGNLQRFSKSNLYTPLLSLLSLMYWVDRCDHYRDVP